MQLNKQKPFVLIGGGGHAKIILDMLALHDVAPTMYVDDDDDKPWLNAMGLKRMTDETLPAGAQCTISFGAITTDMLSVRRNRQRSLQAKGLVFPAIIHPRAIVSNSATIGDGVHVCAGAIINAGASIGAGSIINSGAIIEHDVAMGEGCHVAPGATVLGDAVLGDEVFVGSGAVIIQRARVGSCNFVRAMTCHTGNI